MHVHKVLLMLGAFESDDCEQEQKLSSYSLNAVSAEFLGEQKEESAVWELIFGCHKRDIPIVW